MVKTTSSGAAAGGGGTSFAGSQTTESTTTSTSAVDVISSTLGTSITVAEAFKVVVDFRKTSGAVTAVGLGLKLNTTTVSEAAISGSVPRAAYTDEAENGVAQWLIGTRATNYLNAIGGYYGIVGATNGGVGTLFPAAGSTPAPNATITTVVIRGISGSASVTCGVDELFFYAIATS